MGIHVEIKLDLSSKSKRRLKSAAVVAASIAIVGVGVAIASIDTSWVQDGQPVSASSLKANLDGLQAQITAQAMPVGSIVPSLLMEAQFQAGYTSAIMQEALISILPTPVPTAEATPEPPATDAA